MTNPYEKAETAGRPGSQVLDIVVPPIPMPTGSNHGIALVGCGAIGKVQLQAYKDADWNVVAIVDNKADTARAYRDRLFPKARYSTRLDEVLRFDDVTVVDLATHTAGRDKLVSKSLNADKHVHSQKPFVQDLGVGAELAQLARQRQLRLAVNQNGRWAPHFRALRHVVEEGYVGRIFSADFELCWPHDLILEDHPLSRDPNLVLYDFAIHWFDIVSCLLSDRTPRQVFAVSRRRHGQCVEAPTLASVVISYDDAVATVNLRASARREDYGLFHICGDRGSAHLTGASLGGTSLYVSNDQGEAAVPIEGEWFPDGLVGSMANLLCAIEGNTTPYANATSSLAGLRLCFAAVESTKSGRPVNPEQIEALPT